MSFSVPVCWRKQDQYTPSSNPKNPYVDFYAGATNVYTNDVIPIGSTTTITFKAASTCPYPFVSSFSMKVDPLDPLKLITVQPSNPDRPTDLTIVAQYDGKSTIPLRMTLTGQGGNPVYTIDSGKPIIRNDPRGVVILQYVPYFLVLALVVIAYVAYRWWRRRTIAKEY